MTDKIELAVRAARSAHILRRLNVVTLCVALVVYLGLVTIALFEDVAPLVLFSSCIMLAEVLVFQIVKTLIDHFELMRLISPKP